MILSHMPALFHYNTNISFLVPVMPYSRDRQNVTLCTSIMLIPILMNVSDRKLFIEMEPLHIISPYMYLNVGERNSI